MSLVKGGRAWKFFVEFKSPRLHSTTNGFYGKRWFLVSSHGLWERHIISFGKKVSPNYCSWNIQHMKYPRTFNAPGTYQFTMSWPKQLREPCFGQSDLTICNLLYIQVPEIFRHTMRHHYRINNWCNCNRSCRKKIRENNNCRNTTANLRRLVNYSLHASHTYIEGKSYNEAY